jgi:uncharacterized protein YggT (Ycf19 family)
MWLPHADLPPPDPRAADVAGARDTAHQILARDEFKPPTRSPVRRALDWVGDKLARFIEKLLGVFGGGGGGSLIAWLILVLVVAGIVALVVVRVRRGPVVWVAARSVVVDRSREPADWRAEADDHARHGRFRDALRCRYRALVGDLARRGLLDEIPGRTTGEEREQLRATAPVAASEFGDATDLFDRVWYGDEPTGAGEDDRFRSLADAVMAKAAGADRS